ncbi:MAG: hypothetical protein FWF03_08400, partial [Defluviitaleaceae bacterium]|nr:hypothetical protein [Defluviitaleaceae bacterium]
MNIPNNLLKRYLRNVYFFCGTACGGKTTISKAFAKKHDFLWLAEDTLNELMEEAAEPNHQTAWRSRPADWETYFNRPHEEYHRWLTECGNEMLPLVILELIRLSANAKVAVDMVGMPPKIAMELTEPERIAFLVATPERVTREYYDRPGHRAVYECIMGLRDPEAALANTNKTLAHGTRLLLDELYQSGLFYVMRDDESTVEKTLASV